MPLWPDSSQSYRATLVLKLILLFLGLTNLMVHRIAMLASGHHLPAGGQYAAFCILFIEIY